MLSPFLPMFQLGVTIALAVLLLAGFLGLLLEIIAAPAEPSAVNLHVTVVIVRNVS